MENKFVIQVQPRVQGDISRIALHTPFGLQPQGVWNTTRDKSPYTPDWTWITSNVQLVVTKL